jgi:beta-glucosidase
MMKKMKMNYLFVLLLGFWPLISEAQNPKAQDPKMDAFIRDLMQKMTLQEKIGQLNLVTAGEATTGSVVSTDVEAKIKAGQIGGIFSMSTPTRIRKAQELAVNHTRLKIPILFGMDVIHGYKTVFPIPLGMAATWDMDLVQQSARIAAIEASADGIHWTFSPMVDITRDARWGRYSEGSGEDPFLGSKIAQAMVRGYQGEDLKAINTLMACVKHFALYGAAEAGMDYNTTDMSLQRMYNEYFPPYKAAIDAGAGTIMTSFNDINGTPATANKWLLTEVLRHQWGFDGMVVADYTAVNELIAHGLGDLQEVSARALEAGLDMDMVGEGFLTTLEASIASGRVKLADIDRACRKVLEVKYKLGLFEDPFRYCNEERAQNEIYTAAHRAKAREIAAQSFVLLKNQNNILPLAKKGTIALIGPLSHSRTNMPGTWSVSADHAATPSLFEGMQQALGNQVNIIQHHGSNLVEDAAYQERATMFGRTIPRDERPETEIIAEALKTAAQADVIVAALGEGSEMSGESSSRTDIGIPAVQQRLLKALLDTGKPVVLVLFTGRPLTLTWEADHVPAILNVWFGGTETGTAVADVLFGDVNPSGKLPATFPQHVGQVPLYYSHKITGRPLAEGKWFEKFRANYLDVSNEPLYPFGFGLSYTTFSYSPIRLTDSILMAGQKLLVEVDITNTGSRDGAEVVQLYLRDVVSTSTRPIKELKGFKKIFLKAGEKQTVQFVLTEEELKYYNAQLEHVAEPGEFLIHVGTNAQEVQTKSFFYKKS